jgi:hypothetical protein
MNCTTKHVIRACTCSPKRPWFIPAYRLRLACMIIYLRRPSLMHGSTRGCARPADRSLVPLPSLPGAVLCKGHKSRATTVNRPCFVCTATSWPTCPRDCALARGAMGVRGISISPSSSIHHRLSLPPSLSSPECGGDVTDRVSGSMPYTSRHGRSICAAPSPSSPSLLSRAPH